MDIEPLPDDCLPFGGDERRIRELLRGPQVDHEGRIVGGLWDGMTPQEVIEQRERYRRIVGE